jgi:hypothetical protein
MMNDLRTVVVRRRGDQVIDKFISVFGRIGSAVAETAPKRHQRGSEAERRGLFSCESHATTFSALRSGGNTG